MSVCGRFCKATELMLCLALLVTFFKHSKTLQMFPNASIMFLLFICKEYEAESLKSVFFKVKFKKGNFDNLSRPPTQESPPAQRQVKVGKINTQGLFQGREEEGEGQEDARRCPSSPSSSSSSSRPRMKIGRLDPSSIFDAENKENGSERPRSQARESLESSDCQVSWALSVFFIFFNNKLDVLHFLSS